jgi:hypothetical protein
VVSCTRIFPVQRLHDAGRLQDCLRSAVVVHAHHDQLARADRVRRARGERRALGDQCIGLVGAAVPDGDAPAALDEKTGDREAHGTKAEHSD